MKLRKAMEKAKDRRNSAGVVNMPKKQEKSKTDNTHWMPPSYTTSRTAHINPLIARNNRCIGLQSDALEAESYKVLRAKIQQNVLQHGKRTLLITSPTQSDGKTLTASNLAVTFAKAYNQTVLLADCDLKRQGVHKLFGIPSDLGIHNYLVDNMPLEEIIIWPGIEKLSMISGGKPTHNSAEILSSPRMKALIGEFKSRYDDRIVILDSPPILTGADTIELASMADSVLLVVSEGKTFMNDVKSAIELIPSEKLAGIVMNRAQSGEYNKYYYEPE